MQNNSAMGYSSHEVLVEKLANIHELILLISRGDVAITTFLFI